MKNKNIKTTCPYCRGIATKLDFEGLFECPECGVFAIHYLHPRTRKNKKIK